jgi:hypothetical protein
VTFRGAAQTLLCLMVILAAAACSKPPPADPFRSGQRVANDDARARDVLTAHLASASQRHALRGSARVAIESIDFRLNRPQRIAIERPGRLRFEVLGLFDVLAAMLVSDGREFGFFDASTGEITRGTMTPDVLWELAQLDLEADEVVDLLLASPTPGQDYEICEVWLDAESGWSIVYADGASRIAEVFRFDVHGLLREVRAIGADGATRYVAVFEAHAPLAESEAGSEAVEDSSLAPTESARLYPMRITVHSPRVDARARFEWKRIDLVDDLPDGFFSIPKSRLAGG